MRDLDMLETVSVRGPQGRVRKLRVRPKLPQEGPGPVGPPTSPMEAPEVLLAELLSDASNLEEELRAFGPLPIRDALDTVVDVAGALDFLHSLGVAYRDLSAADVVPIPAGGAEAAAPRQRLAGLLLPAQLNPASREGDRRRDARMLGLLLYHVLSGRRYTDARLFALAQRRRVAPAAGGRPDAHLHPAVTLQADALLRRLLDPARARATQDALRVQAEAQRLRELCDRERLGARAHHAAPGQQPPVGPGLLERAAQQAWEATQSLPENAAPWIHLGNVHLVAMRPLAAQRAYEQALRRDPGSVVARTDIPGMGVWTAALAGMSTSIVKPRVCTVSMCISRPRSSLL